MPGSRTKRRGRGRPPVEEITDAQRRTFEAIRDYIEAQGQSPTLAELGKILGVNSTPVYDSVTQLVQKGYLERERYSRRGIRVLREPVGKKTKPLVSLPLLGTVSAGLPALAEKNIEGMALVPAEFVKGDSCFALMVSGESMKGAGMRDGDTVIIRQQALARHGEIVVAMLDGENAVIKRLYRVDDRIELRAENRQFKPHRVTAESDFRIIGKVIAQSSQWS